MKISKLTHTWLMDIDGTILKHNGHLDVNETLLPGVKEFWNKIPKDDTIILLTARPEEYRDETLKFLRTNDIRFDMAVFNLPPGERIVVNDNKPSGLKTAVCVNIERDSGLLNINIDLDEKL